MSKKKEIIFGIITVLAVLAFAEIVFRNVINYQNALGDFEKKTTFAAYQNKTWADQYFKDNKECSGERLGAMSKNNYYVRYLLFDVGPECHTQTVNYIGGIMRKTWNPEIPSGVEHPKVYNIGMFGGSTTLGLGTIDDETIPSNFSKLANAGAPKNTYYPVTNYGVSSYTFTQGLMKLILLLRDGYKFDYVMFYGGTNDIDRAYENGRAGALQDENKTIDKLQGGLWARIKNEAVNQLNECGICKAIVVISRHTPILKDYLTPYLVRMRDFIMFKAGENKSADEMPKFAGEIADYYAKSHYLLDALSKAYGFKYAEFWQPALFYEKNGPVGGEKLIYSIDTSLSDPKLIELYGLVKKDVDDMRLNNFFDISDALEGRTSAYYLDAVHVNDSGNAAVAGRILAAVKNQLPK
jgi:lysophospholipase L1-like esterase